MTQVSDLGPSWPSCLVYSLLISLPGNSVLMTQKRKVFENMWEKEKMLIASVAISKESKNLRGEGWGHKVYSLKITYQTCVHADKQTHR